MQANRRSRRAFVLHAAVACGLGLATVGCHDAASRGQGAALDGPAGDDPAERVTTHDASSVHESGEGTAKPNTGAAAGGAAAGADPSGTSGTPADTTRVPEATPTDPALVARANALLQRYDAIQLGGDLTPPPSSDAGRCDDARKSAASRRGIGLLTSPRQWVVGEEARLLVAVASGDEPLAVRVEDANGKAVPTATIVRGPNPWSAAVRFTPNVSGKHQVILGRDGVGLRCDDVVVMDGTRATRVPAIDRLRVWEVTRAWGPAEEALYAAWVRELFHAPVGAELAWRRFDEVTSDASRNLLHGALGWGEDEPGTGLRLEPDCADAPYYLRAYFSWKRGLPFTFRRCGRGLGDAPKCAGLASNFDAPEVPASWAEDAKKSHLHVVERWFRRTLASGVHTGNARTANGDPNSDFYPLELRAEAIDPGSIYADPYGHVFVVVEFVPGKDGLPGVLYAIDGQPDASITRKRFWEGNFLWNSDPALGGSGFKGFRPVVVSPSKPTADGVTLPPSLTTLDDETLDRPHNHGPSTWWDVDTSGVRRDSVTFHREMRRIITPQGEDPGLALTAAVVALWEAAKVRVVSVDNGLRHRKEHPEAPVVMPTGAAIFETTGPWEDFATPARDLRLLVALDVVSGFPKAVAADPGQFGLGSASAAEIAAVEQELEALRDHLLTSERFTITYTRSDGTPWSLRLADLLARRDAFEAAYDPNDCAEIRWGVSRDGLSTSDEGRTCDGQTTPENLAKLQAYRVWFHERRRPARGDVGPPVE